MTGNGCPVVPVSWGELLDKITILEIKQGRIAGADARANVAKECALLRDVAAAAMKRDAVASLLAELKAVNEALWEIEDAIRDQEAAAQFGPEFIRLARSVYRRNDERAALKRAINLRLGSELIEEKSYKGWGDAVLAPAVAPAAGNPPVHGPLSSP
jgi:hypothetical protein